MDHAGILSTTGYVIEVVIGVSLIIFVHELGHFMAAKWAGVKVRRFFFGFAPSFTVWGRKITLQFFAIRIGETQYGLGMLPFGGFVDMAGEQEGFETDDTPKERQFTSKSPGQRAVIFVAGAAMNAIFAVVFFIVAFIVGVSFVRPIVGDVIEGGPAWQAGILPGDRILEIDGEEQKEFTEMLMKVALADPDTTLNVKIQRGDEILQTQLMPVPDPAGRGMTVGIKTNAEPVVAEVREDSPAKKAGLQVGDRIVGLSYTQVDTGQKEEVQVSSYLDILNVTRDSRYIEKPIELQVERGAGEDTETLHLTVNPAIHEKAPRILGITPVMTKIGALRRMSDANKQLKPGDVIESVQGEPFFASRQFTERSYNDEAVVLGVRRDSEIMEIPVRGADFTRWLKEDIAFDYPMMEPEAIAGDVQVLMPAALAGMKPGDRIVSVDGQTVATFADVAAAIRAKTDGPVEIAWARQAADGTSKQFTASMTPAPARENYTDIGIGFRQDRFVQRVGNPLAAIAIGWNRTVLWGKRVFLVLKGLFTRQVSPRNLAGPVGIFTISYAVTQFGTGTLLYFLAMISINLAILNVFPIPVLDGGHLLFLGIEKIKGSPVTLKTQMAAQTVGLVLLLSMALFVTYNDIARLITGF